MHFSHNFYLCTVFAAVFAYLSSNTHSPALNFLSRRVRSVILPSGSFEAQELRSSWGSPHRDINIPTPISAIEAEEHYKRLKKRTVEGYSSNSAFAIQTPTTTSVWFVTTYAAISWSTIPSNVSRVSLKLYRGSVWGTSYFDDIASYLPRGTTSYQWTIPPFSNSTGTSLLGDYLYQVLIIGYDDSGIAMVNERSSLFHIGGIQINGIAGGNTISDPTARTAGNSYLVSYDSWSWGQLSTITISLRDKYYYYMTVAQDVSNANHTFLWEIPDLVDQSTDFRLVFSANTSPKDASAGSSPGQLVTASFAAPIFHRYPNANPSGYAITSITPSTISNAGVNQTIMAVTGSETNTLYNLYLYSLDPASAFRSGFLWASGVTIIANSLLLPRTLPSGYYVLIAKRTDGAVRIVSATFLIVAVNDNANAVSAQYLSLQQPKARTNIIKGGSGTVQFALTRLALRYVNVTLYLASQDTGTPSCSPSNAVFQLASFVKPYYGSVTFNANPSWLSSAAYYVGVQGVYDDIYYYATPQAQYSFPSACGSYFFIQGAGESVPSSVDSDNSTSADQSSIAKRNEPATFSSFIILLLVLLAF